MRASFAAITVTTAVVLFTGCAGTPTAGNKTEAGHAASSQVSASSDRLVLTIHTDPEGADIFSGGHYNGVSPWAGPLDPLSEYSKAIGIVSTEITAVWPNGVIWDGNVITSMPPGHPLKTATVSLKEPATQDGPYQTSLRVRMMAPLFALEDQRLRAKAKQAYEQEMAQMRARQQAAQRQAQIEAQQQAQQERQAQQTNSGPSGADILLMMLGGFVTGFAQGLNNHPAPVMVDCTSNAEGKTIRTSCY
ncbi:hypothetical protein RI103_14405 [Paraburkholderia sp. FT54]|uniref:hypothetical protein n=1 Tax=Paraburkholderia sp. FT54 TaxID=3074437 RepID=UPI0028780D71|nr:hypothetical protein [Paraburkholderia sp. FT54]WNC88878.1 hypothetical protein RI103_14405 [Paraburkholderia sp. FT54]